jgi:NADH-quinone oxidoreductase subunit C
MSQPMATLLERFGSQVEQLPEFRGETSLRVQADALQRVARFCHGELGFDYLVDITSVDHFGEDPRFEVIYELSSIATSFHLRLKVLLPEQDPQLPSVSAIWPTADWHEREVFDMMGIRFAGHPDLRRILMWEGFPHHPLRKDFPLEGKSTDVPEVAFTSEAPLAGGPFVTSPVPTDTRLREPRARRAGDLPPEPSDEL